MGAQEQYPNVEQPAKIYKRSLGRHVATIIKTPENKIIRKKKHTTTLLTVETWPRKKKSFAMQ